MPGAARRTDMHVCPMVSPGPIPHVGGQIIGGATNVLINKLPAARVSDMAACVGPPDTIMHGSKTVFIAKKPAARNLDTTAHGGKITTGSDNVIIGD